MNGHLTSVFIWIINALISLIVLLIGFIVKQHLNSDKEHRESIEKEVGKIRDRIHKVEGTTANIMGLIKAKDL